MQVKNQSDDRLSPDEIDHCETLFRAIAEEMMGEAMIFETTERIKEYLQEINEKFVDLKHLEDEEQEKREAEVKESFQGMIAATKLDYVPVNHETFIEWETAFREEMRTKKQEELDAQTPSVKKA